MEIQIRYLFFRVSESREIVNGVEHCTLVSNAGIKEVLPPALVNTNALEHQPLRESRLHWTYLEDRIHMQRSRPHRSEVLLHPIPYDFTPDHHAWNNRVRV